MKEFNEEYLDNIRKIIAEHDDAKARELLDELHPADIAELYNDLDLDQAEYLYKLLGGDKAADVLMELESRAWISTQMTEPFLDPDHRVFNICTMDGQAYYVSGKAMSACRSVSWAQQIFEVVTPRAFDAAAATVTPGCTFAPLDVIPCPSPQMWAYSSAQ